MPKITIRVETAPYLVNLSQDNKVSLHSVPTSQTNKDITWIYHMKSEIEILLITKVQDSCLTDKKKKCDFALKM